MDISTNKKGFAGAMVSIAIILLVVGAVGYIFYKNVSKGGAGIKEILSKYGAPKIDDNSTYLYSVTDFYISEASKCTADAKAGTFNCPKDQYIDFSAKIQNGGTRMRKIAATTLVCEAQCTRRGCEPKKCPGKTTTTGEPCYIIDSKEMDCSAGSYKFLAGEYIIVPGAVCAMDASIGCYEAAMIEPDSIMNPDKAITIKVT